MVFRKRNDALRINSPTANGATADVAITTHGSDFYFAICSVMGVATIAFLALALRKPRTDRIFHYITAAVVMVACIAYWSMGAGLGFTPIEIEFKRSAPRVRGTYREIFWVRYVDWFITTPLLLMDLLLTAGMPWPTVLWVILVDEVMIVTGLVGALTKTTYKWGYFTFGCAALLYIVYMLGFEARKHSRILGADVGRVFFQCGTLTLVLWIIYPIAWGVCEGGNVIAPDSEAVFYGILDFLAKPVFGALLIWGHRGIDPARLGMRIRDYEEDPSVTGGLHRGEKHTGAHNGAHNGVTNGHQATNGTAADNTATTAV